MSVLIETSLGDIVIDLYCDECPKSTFNFLKLCKIKFFNNCIFHNVQKDLLIQSGDPSWTGRGGESVYAKLYGDQARFFEGEPNERLTHAKAGTVSMVVSGKVGQKSLHGSQFIITTGDDKRQFDGQFSVIGRVAEGMDVVMQINEVYCDESGRPYRNVRLRHLAVLEDPFPDPPGLMIPPVSPQYVPLDSRREADEPTMKEMASHRSEQELEEERKAQEAFSRAQMLTMLGDMPDADAAPPEEVLFVCKLHPVTQEEDLEIIFSRFGPVKKVEIIRDRKTGKSLCYGFVEFETREACVEAYIKMDNVLIDEKRIHVDFCQSVGKVWQHRMLGVPLPEDALRARRTSENDKDKKKKKKKSKKRSRSRSKEKKKKSKK